MLTESRCSIRKCKYYVGIIQPDGTEKTEAHFCGAFVKGIPIEIAYGNDLHETVKIGQDKPYVYEKDLDWENHLRNIAKEDVNKWLEINKMKR